MNEDTQDTPPALELEVGGIETVAALERAQVDMQIATAKKYPRSIAKAKADMVSLATLDEETAAGTFFTLPARKGGDGKPIQGPSIRMAEIALSSWGNIKAGSRVIADDGKSIVAQAVVIDLEKNVAVSLEVRRRVTNKRGERYSEDMVNTTANAACSIALRNATFRVVPAAIIRPVYEQAKRVAVGDVKSLTAKRAQVLERLKKMGATEAAIFAAVGVSRVEDIDADKLADLLGFGTAIKEGSATLEEVFPNPDTTGTTQPAAPVFKETAKASAPKPDPIVQAAAEPKPEPVPVKVATAAAPPPPPPAPTTSTASTQTAHQILADALLAAGIAFDRFAAWATEQGFDLGNATTFDEIPATTAVRLNRSTRGMVAAINGGAK